MTGQAVRTVLSVRTDDGVGGVASSAPALSWYPEGVPDGWTQTGADLSLTRPAGVESRTIEGRSSVGVPWPFASLASDEGAELRVRLRGETPLGAADLDWSEPLAITCTALDRAWQADLIGLPGAGPEDTTLLRTRFHVEAPIARAVLRTTALGSYLAHLNGELTDDSLFKPGWTVYRERVQYETSDVTHLVHGGENVLAVHLGGMWATEAFGFRGDVRRQFEQPGFSSELVLTESDGTTRTIRTGPSWRAAPGPETSASLYQGEHVDARLVDPEWTQVDFDDSGWVDAAVLDGLPQPTPRLEPPIRRTQDIAVHEVITSPSGQLLLDFGQNLVGRLRIKVSGPPGTKVVLRHAEVLEHGELGTRPLREAAATDSYILAGRGIETWEPAFTFHGFRYAEISGWPGDFDPADVTAVVLGSDMERTGWFASSHDVINQLHENIVWGLRGNFLSIPTDCPQRNERLGWTGDIQVFSPTASYLYDVAGFLESWLIDLALDQRAYGGLVPEVIPNVFRTPRGATAWGDAATVVPSVLYERFGDPSVLAEQFDSMAAWTRWVLGRAGEDHIWNGDFQFGDWLDPAAPPDRPGQARTEHDLTATAYLIRSCDLTARAAGLLGKEQEQVEFAEHAALGRAAFRRAFVTGPGLLTSDAQTAYALLIMFDVVPADEQQPFGDRLAALVAEEDYRIGTGFVGTPIILDALDRAGHTDTIERLLLQTENPSWLYPVTMGATTIWERWDSMLPDGTINPGQMTSFNHYAFGAVGDWLHRRLCGLAPAEPGYRRLTIAPVPLPAFTHAEARHLTPYGEASVRWERSAGTFSLVCRVPPNTTADIQLPDGTVHNVGSGEYRFECREATPG